MNNVGGIDLPSNLIWMIIKSITGFGLFVYIIFAFIVIKQVRLMTDTLELGFEKGVKVLSYIHFIVAVFAFVIALLIS